MVSTKSTMITHIFSEHKMYVRALLNSNIDDIHYWDFRGELQRTWWVEHGCILYCNGDLQDTWIVQWPNERDLMMFTLKYG